MWFVLYKNIANINVIVSEKKEPELENYNVKMWFCRQKLCLFSPNHTTLLIKKRFWTPFCGQLVDGSSLKTWLKNTTIKCGFKKLMCFYYLMEWVNAFTQHFSLKLSFFPFSFQIKSDKKQTLTNHIEVFLRIYLAQCYCCMENQWCIVNGW